MGSSFHQFRLSCENAEDSSFLTSAAESGAGIFKVMEVSQHKSVDTLRGYVRRADLFREHVGAAFSSRRDGNVAPVIRLPLMQRDLTVECHQPPAPGMGGRIRRQDRGASLSADQAANGATFQPAAASFHSPEAVLHQLTVKVRGPVRFARWITYRIFRHVMSDFSKLCSTVIVPLFPDFGLDHWSEAPSATVG
jgi:hypothetical protein